MSASKTTSQLNAADRRNKLIAIAAGVLMLGIVYYEWQGVNDSAPAPAAVTAPQTSAAPVVKTAVAPGTAAGVPAKTIGSTAGALDPTLHMQAMLVTEAVNYTGSGRNLFAAPGTVEDVPATIPKVMTPVRTVGPVAPPRPITPIVQGPPPIDLKFFGMVTSSGGRQAMLLHGDDVFLASKGDIVQRKYRVVDIGANSIQVEDMSTNNKQTLPLQAAP
jgi:hypothetical protein